MSNSSVKRIGVAVLWFGDRLVFQLRDFRPDIDDPGQWGLFGGHINEGEASEVGVQRELREELGWAPATLTPLGVFEAQGRAIVGFAGTLDIPWGALVLNEGCDIGAFSVSEIQAGALYSIRCRSHFPLTAITRAALERWCLIQQP